MERFDAEIVRIPLSKEQLVAIQTDPELLAAARKGAEADVPAPVDPSSLVGVKLYAIVDGQPREVGVVLDYTSDSVVVGVNRK